MLTRPPGLCESEVWSSRRRHDATTSRTEGSTRSQNGGRHGNHRKRDGDPRLSRRDTGRGAGRPPQTPRGHTLARTGDRRRRVTGRAARDDAGACALLGHRVRLQEGGGEVERGASVHHGDRRPRYPLHPRQVAARERVAAHHHARLAGLDHRDAERRRSAQRPDCTRRRLRGRVRRRGSLDAGLWVLGETERYRLGSDPHRGGLDRPDETPRLCALRRARRRLGCADH